MELFSQVPTGKTAGFRNLWRISTVSAEGARRQAESLRQKDRVMFFPREI